MATLNINNNFKARILQLYASQNPTNLNHAKRLGAVFGQPWFTFFDWILASKSEDDREAYVYGQFYKALLTNVARQYPDTYFQDRKSALNSLVRFTWKIFDGAVYASDYIDNLTASNLNALDLLTQMVSGTSIFSDEKIIKEMHGDNDFCMNGDKIMIRDTKCEKNEIIINRSVGNITYPVLYADDNTYANRKLKEAIALGWGFDKECYRLFVNFTVCHIWDSPNDPRYYLNLKNLALVPTFLSGLTDHNAHVQETLRYHTFAKFGLLDPQGATPTQPQGYDILTWRDNSIL